MQRYILARRSKSSPVPVLYLPLLFAPKFYQRGVPQSEEGRLVREAPVSGSRVSLLPPALPLAGAACSEHPRGEGRGRWLLPG